MTAKRPNAGVAAYIRVSSATQSAAMQREAITRAAKQRGDVIAQWFEERQSGKTLARPQLDAVRQLAHEGRVSKLYVWKLDRLTRSGIVDTLNVVRELREIGCMLVCIADPVFHFEGPAGDIILSVVAGVAQLELQANAERRAAARERVLAAGGTWGRPKRMTPAALERARVMAAHGSSVRAIAMILKVPKATIARSLRRLKSTPPNGAAREAKKAGRTKSVPPPSH